MAVAIWKRTTISGGGVDSLDIIDGALLNDGDFAFVMTSANECWIYNLDADSGAAESIPTIIIPDTNPGSKRWLLQNQVSTNVHIPDTDYSHDLILECGSNLSADRTLTFTTGDADRTLTLSGNLTVESASLVNQDLTSDAGPSWAHSHTTDTIADNDSTTINATTAYAKSQDAVIAREPDQGVALTAAASGSSGITVADNDNIDFGTGNFTLVWKGSLPDWTPSAATPVIGKFQGVADYIGFYIDTNGSYYYVHTKTGGTTVAKSSTILNTFTNGTVHEIIVIVTRETASVAGSVAFYADGLLVETLTIAAGTPADISNTGSLEVLGRNAVRYAGTVHHAYTLNFAPTAAEVLDMYRNGIPESWKWGSQTSLVDAAASVFTSGTYGWAVYGGNTIANVGNALEITYVDNQYGAYNTLTNAVDLTTDLVVGKRYRLKADAKYTGGSSGTKLHLYLGVSTPKDTLTTSLVTYTYEFTATSTTADAFNVMGMSAGNVVTIDNWYLYEIGATLALVPEGIQPNRWLDASSNHLDATFPTTGWSLTRPIPNQPVLTNLLTNSQWMAMSGSTLENVGSAVYADPCSSDLTAGWASSGTLAFDTDHYEFTATGGGDDVRNNAAFTALSAGKLYKFSIDVKSGTAGAITFNLRFLAVNPGYGVLHTSPTYTSTGTSTTYTFTIESLGTERFIDFNTIADLGGNNIEFKNVTFYEVTPGYVAADSLGPDGYYITSGLSVLRQHNDGGTYTKDGSFYSLWFDSITAADHMIWPLAATKVLAEHYQKFAGRTVTFGAWCWASTASHMFLQIVDSDTTDDNQTSDSSAYHSGGSTWEWLEVTMLVSATTTEFSVAVCFDSTTDAYFSQPMLVYGSSIGQGNASAIVNEQILTAANIALTGYTATTSAADAIINLEAASSGMIGKGVKAVLVKAYGKDSAAGDGIGFDVQSASGVEDGISIDTQVNNIKVQGQGWVKCDANGDIYFDHRGSGASALTVDIKVIGIQT